MYIIEIIAKIIRKSRRKTRLFPEIKPDTENNRQEDCEGHIYLPIDSTKEYLACKNCGHIIKNKKQSGL